MHLRIYHTHAETEIHRPTEIETQRQTDTEMDKQTQRQRTQMIRQVESNQDNRVLEALL